MCKGEVCGACTGALMALGLKFGQCEDNDEASRYKTNEIAVKFFGQFREENGSYICKELLGCYPLRKVRSMLLNIVCLQSFAH